mmetsp:Transcript_1029/g.2144  ORF Transcript_1029/g.2144 Transcript_1029/m.2144 type:complete len:88 (+) Transcript_1029:1448-1711(+)
MSVCWRSPRLSLPHLRPFLLLSILVAYHPSRSIYVHLLFPHFVFVECYMQVLCSVYDAFFFCLSFSPLLLFLPNVTLERRGDTKTFD